MSLVWLLVSASDDVELLEFVGRQAQNERPEDPQRSVEVFLDNGVVVSLDSNDVGHAD